MRLVQIAVPTGYLEAVKKVLSDNDIQYVLSEETSGRDIAAVVSFPLPAGAVEPILNELKEAGIDQEDYTVVLEASTVISRPFEVLKEQWEEAEADSRISRAELKTRANDLLPTRLTFFTMTAVSAIVATAGVLMDSAAVVVGSMVIAPLVGPALSASVGTVIDDHDLRRTGIRWQLLGVILAVVSATVFALILRYANLVPPGIAITDISQVDERLTPDFLALAIAIGAGVAGALSLSTGVSAALVGVMIAVALIPPAAVIGIGIAWGMPMVVLGSSILLILNVLAINLAALGVFWNLGYRPSSWFRVDVVKSQLIKRVAFLVIVILGISVFLGVVTFASYQASVQEDAIEGAVHAALDDPAYEEMSVIDIAIIRTDQPILAQPVRVIVTIGYPRGTESVGVADEIATAIEEQIDRSIEVEVRHVERERSG